MGQSVWVRGDEWADLTRRVRESCLNSNAIIAIDGPGGAGKSSLARQLAAELGDAVVVPTDDFAAWDDPLDWWPRMLTDVIEPASAGCGARYQRRRFMTGTLQDWVSVAPAAFTIIEGVSSSRSEWSGYLCFSVWVETPRAERLRRGLARDGDDARGLWEAWMSAEDAFFAVDRPWERASVVVSGTNGRSTNR